MEIQIASMKEACESRHLLMNAYHGTLDNKLRNKCLIDFCSKFIDLVSLIDPKTCKKHHTYIFQLNPDFKSIDVINAHLLTAKEYAMDVIAKISPKVDEDFSTCLIGVLFDFQKLLSVIELTIPYLKYAGETGNRNMQVDSYSSYQVANHIFNGSVKDLYTLNGFTIFAIRQSIESASKELLGLDMIKEDLGNGNYKDYYNTQLPLKYLACRKFDLNFDFNCDTVEMFEIYKWANNFVHTGKNSVCYVMFFALKTLEKLHKVTRGYNYSGLWEFQRVNRIYNYDLVKIDFENFLRKQYKDKILKTFWSIRGAYLSKAFVKNYTPIIKTKEYIIHSIKKEIKTHGNRSSVLSLDNYNIPDMPDFTINFKGKIYVINISDFAQGIFVKIYPFNKSSILVDQIYIDTEAIYNPEKIKAYVSNDFTTIKEGNQFWETYKEYNSKAYMKELFRRLKL